MSKVAPWSASSPRHTIHEGSSNSHSQSATLRIRHRYRFGLVSDVTAREDGDSSLLLATLSHACTQRHECRLAVSVHSAGNRNYKRQQFGPGEMVDNSKVCLHTDQPSGWTVGSVRSVHVVRNHIPNSDFCIPYLVQYIQKSLLNYLTVFLSAL